MRRFPILLSAVFLVGFAAAFLLPEPWIRTEGEASMPHEEDVGWACPMFCVVMDDQPADERCPVCGMELGPVAANARLDTHERMMIGLEGTRLAKVVLEKELLLHGEVDHDEARVAVVSARADGWIEKLNVPAIGAEVEKGMVLHEQYAPRIYESQLEWLAATGDQSLQDAIARRLVLLGVDATEISALRSRRTATRRTPVRAPRDGIIIKRSFDEGAHVARGASLFTIVDLTKVWIQLEVFEPDLPWLREGTSIQLSDPALDASAFEGHVAFVDPIVDRATRTARVRVEVANRRTSGGRWLLLPGQRLEARARIPVGPEGRVLESPEAARPILALPRASVLRTGRRSVVYLLRDEGKTDSPFDLDPDALPQQLSTTMVEVEIGPLATRSDAPAREEFYPLRRVVTGRDPRAPQELLPGMVVVTEGAYLIDSQAQLAGRPSLLYPDGRAASASGQDGH